MEQKDITAIFLLHKMSALNSSAIKRYGHKKKYTVKEENIRSLANSEAPNAPQEKSESRAKDRSQQMCTVHPLCCMVPIS